MTSVKRIRKLSSRPPNQPAERTDRDADDEDDDLDHEGHGDADPGTVEEPTQEVTAQLVRAQDVVRRERREWPPAVREDGRRGPGLWYGHGREERSEDADEQPAR